MAFCRFDDAFCFFSLLAICKSTFQILFRDIWAHALIHTLIVFFLVPMDGFPQKLQASHLPYESLNLFCFQPDEHMSVCCVFCP